MPTSFVGTRRALVRAKVTSHSLPAGLEADQGGGVGVTTGDSQPGPPSPFFYQPDPERDYWVQAKATKLERRGQRHFVIVGEKPDGESVEARISPTAIFEMRGI
ncbi:MAG TPA: hypothetical protein VFA42_08820 [Gaiellaceae bacterium]|nr:hypothetical protein [Gaiellaceae bacterium]